MQISKIKKPEEFTAVRFAKGISDKLGLQPGAFLHIQILDACQFALDRMLAEGVIGE